MGWRIPQTEKASAVGWPKKTTDIPITGTLVYIPFVLAPESSEFNVFAKALVEDFDSHPFYHLVLVLISLGVFGFCFFYPLFIVFLPVMVSHPQFPTFFSFCN